MYNDAVNILATECYKREVCVSQRIANNRMLGSCHVHFTIDACEQKDDWTRSTRTSTELFQTSVIWRENFTRYRDVLRVITVVDSPSIMPTLCKVRFTACTAKIIQPDLSAAWSVRQCGINNFPTMVSDTAHLHFSIDQSINIFYYHHQQ